MSTPRKPIVYIISAPSGSGKSTLVNVLLAMTPRLDFSISYTTRPLRGSEQNGKQYYFVLREEFEQMITADEFLDLLLDIDVQGAAQIKKKLPDAVSIFVLPPDRKTLEWRLRKRGEDSDAVIDRRLEEARREIENYDKYDYILINDRLEESSDSLQAIVEAERLRRSGRSLSLEEKRIVNMADSNRLANARHRVLPILASFRTPGS